jgi:hypothetical protein
MRHLQISSRIHREKPLGSEQLPFYLSEITCMEIHSVIGKYRRGEPKQNFPCDRNIDNKGQVEKCHNTCVFPGREKLKPRIYRDLKKLVEDIEAQRGPIQATTIPLDSLSIRESRKLLMRNADSYKFGSLDALIAGSVVATKQVHGLDLTLVTLDRGLRAMLSHEGIPYLDPATL